MAAMLAAALIEAVLTVAMLPRALPAPPDTALVGPGVYKPLQPPEVTSPPVPVAAFLLDRAPVTNRQLLAFLGWNPQYRRDVVDRLLAEEEYLSRWQGPMTPGPAAPLDAPAVEVSWFVARAYCAWRGERLPTEAEWELAAMASETAKDGTADPKWRAQILDWYAEPAPKLLPPVAQGHANAYGVYDLHGLVWEWVDDFGSDLVTEDGRANGAKMARRFCGGGALSAVDPTDYAAFMRVAFRSSIKAADTTSTLGFRCAASLPKAQAKDAKNETNAKDAKNEVKP